MGLLELVVELGDVEGVILVGVFCRLAKFMVELSLGVFVLACLFFLVPFASCLGFCSIELASFVEELQPLSGEEVD